MSAIPHRHDPYRYPSGRAYDTVTSMLAAGLVWRGACHADRARSWLPVERGAVLARLAEREAEAERREAAASSPMGVESLGYSGELVPGGDL